VSAPLTYTMHQKGSEGKAIQSEGETGRVTTAAQRLRPNTFMPRARLCRAEHEQLPKSQHIPATCAIYRGANIRHNPGGICYPKCGQQTPFIPSEVRKNLIRELLPDLYSLSMAPDYAAQKRAKSQRYHRIAAVTQDNQGRGIRHENS